MPCSPRVAAANNDGGGKMRSRAYASRHTVRRTTTAEIRTETPAEWRNNSRTRPSPAVRGGRRLSRSLWQSRRFFWFSFAFFFFFYLCSVSFFFFFFTAVMSTVELIYRFHGFHSSSRDTRRPDRLSTTFFHKLHRYYAYHRFSLSSYRVNMNSIRNRGRNRVVFTETCRLGFVSAQYSEFS